MATTKVPNIETQIETQEEAPEKSAQSAPDALAAKVATMLAAVKKDEVFFLVNPAGAVHQVDEAHFMNRLNEKDYREATDEEVEAYVRAEGKQIASDPIGFRELGNLKRKRRAKSSK